jgi:hypothetical protein
LIVAADYPNLEHLTLDEQRAYWHQALKNIDALTLESYINRVMEPESEVERRRYELRVKAQANLRRAHEEWLATLPEEETPPGVKE